MSPFANTVRAEPVNQGLGSSDLGQLLQQLGLLKEQQATQTAARVPEQVATKAYLGRAADPNPFEGNEQYQALMEYQQSLAPTQEEQARLQELQSAFQGTGAYKDYRIQQMEQQMQQMQQRYRQPQMQRRHMGLGMANPYGMQPYQGFGRPQQFPMPMQQPMYQFGAMGYNQPQQYMPQPQQFGGYNQYQQMGGYGSYGGMPNPYQPQQMGYNPSNYSGYAGQQNYASFY